jgi:trehalose-phosphatase
LLNKELHSKLLDSMDGLWKNREMKHLLSHWPSVEPTLQKHFLLLGFDYDGTLTVPGVETGDLARRIRQQLKQLASKRNCQAAVISGRSLENLTTEIGIPGLVLAGNHGLEIEGPEFSYRVPLVREVRGAYDALINHLVTGGFLRAEAVDDKQLTLTLNFNVPETQRPALGRLLLAQLAPYLKKGLIQARTGRWSVEVQPAAWNKGQAIRWLKARLEKAVKSAPVFPVFMGDDISDEDGFAAVRKEGLAVLIGKPRSSQADYYLEDAYEVLYVMEKILKSKAVSDG